MSSSVGNSGAAPIGASAPTSATPAAPTTPAASPSAPAGNSAATTGYGASEPSIDGGWDQKWLERFRSAGVSSQVIDQLNQTGGQGMSDAELKQVLTEQKAQADAANAAFQQAEPVLFDRVATFLHDHPEGIDLAMLGMPATDPTNPKITQLADISTIVMQAPEAQRAQAVAAIDMLTDDMSGLGMAKMTLPQMVLPGWGAIRVALAELNPQSRTPGTDERVETDAKDYLDRDSYRLTSMMSGGSTALMDLPWAVSGVIVLGNTALGLGMIHKARSYKSDAKAGTNAAIVRKRVDARIAANSGAGQVQSTWQAKSKYLTQSAWQSTSKYLSGTTNNRLISGTTRVEALDHGIAALAKYEAANSVTDPSFARIVLEDIQSNVSRGRINITAGGATKFSPFMGNIGSARGLLLNRYKPIDSTTIRGVPTLALDLNTTGAAAVAHIASRGVDFISPKLREELIVKFGLQAEKFEQTLGSAKAIAKMSDHEKAYKIAAKQTLALREAMLGHAADELRKAGQLTPLNTITGSLRRLHNTPHAQALKATNRLAKVTPTSIGKLGSIPGPMHLMWRGRTKWGKAGVIAALVATSMVTAPKMMGFLMGQPSQDPPADGTAGATDAAAGAAATTEQGVQEFAAKTPEEQYSLMATRYGQIAELASSAGSDPKVAAAVDTAITEFDAYVAAADPSAKAKLEADIAASQTAAAPAQ